MNKNDLIKLLEKGLNVKPTNSDSDWKGASKLMVHGSYSNFMNKKWDHGKETQAETSQILDFLGFCCSTKKNSRGIESVLTALNENNSGSNRKQENYFILNNCFDINMMNHLVATVFSVVTSVTYATDKNHPILPQPQNANWTKLLFCQAILLQIINLIKIFGLNPIISEPSEVRVCSPKFTAMYKEEFPTPQKEHECQTRPHNAKIRHVMELFLVLYQEHMVALGQDEKISFECVTNYEPGDLNISTFHGSHKDFWMRDRNTAGFHVDPCSILTWIIENSGAPEGFQFPYSVEEKISSPDPSETKGKRGGTSHTENTTPKTKRQKKM